MFYDTGLALMLGLNHLKAEREKMWLNIKIINFQLRQSQKYSNIDQSVWRNISF